jgi:hypothetical protein
MTSLIMVATAGGLIALRPARADPALKRRLVERYDKGRQNRGPGPMRGVGGGKDARSS